MQAIKKKGSHKEKLDVQLYIPDLTLDQVTEREGHLMWQTTTCLAW